MSDETTEERIRRRPWHAAIARVDDAIVKAARRLCEVTPQHDGMALAMGEDAYGSLLALDRAIRDRDHALWEFLLPRLPDLPEWLLEEPNAPRTKWYGKAGRRVFCTDGVGLLLCNGDTSGVPASTREDRIGWEGGVSSAVAKMDRGLTHTETVTSRDFSEWLRLEGDRRTVGPATFASSVLRRWVRTAWYAAPSGSVEVSHGSAVGPARFVTPRWTAYVMSCR